MSDLALPILQKQPLTERQAANASGYLRENPGLYFRESDLNLIRDLATPSADEKALKILTEVARRHPIPGETFIIDYWSIPLQPLFGDNAIIQHKHDVWLAVAWAAEQQELAYLVQNLLVRGGFFERGNGPDGYYMLSPEAWRFLSQQQRSSSEDTAFVAMSFAADLLPVFTQGIAPGIRAAGYRELRMDRHEHNNRIDDEMIAQMRRCKFIVADFTHQNQGAYFEAGFVLGLGKPVVWTCERSEVHDKKVHFDTRQYSFVLWTADDLDQFAADLKNRIEATIGRGSVRRE